MKKLVMFLSFAMIMGVVTANAQAPKKEVKKAPVKTEAPAKKKEVKKVAKAAPSKAAPSKAAPAKKAAKKKAKAATPAKK
ncbi:MAG: hypothetical protein M1445_02340 [Bacteroidetes bacterium]|nr:hypothetical protein [Bacteroidota bacterium]